MARALLKIRSNVALSGPPIVSESFPLCQVPPTTISFWRQKTYMILPFPQPPLKK
jgi:hypothetical protein